MPRPLMLALALAAACTTPDTLNMEMMSSMESETRGVVLYPDGQRGHAAMWDTTCEFDTLNGWLIADHDLPSDIEVVEDQLDDVVLGLSPEGLHKVQDRDSDVLVEGAVHGRLFRDGDVGLVRFDADGACVADFGRAVHVVPDGACDEGIGFTTDRGRNLFAATGDGLLRMSPDGTEELGGGVDLAVWDETTDLLYTAKRGDDTVYALDKNGAQAWATTLDGAIRSLDDMGKRGNAIAMIETDKGGELVVIEGHSGELLTAHATPSGDGEITMSDDGRTLAITLPATVYFYDVTAEDEPKKARRTFGSPDPTFLD